MKYDSEETWITVYEAANIDEANVVKGLLEAADIPVILGREAVASIYGLNVGPLSEVAVKVPKDQAPRAGQLLQATDFGEAPE